MASRGGGHSPAPVGRGSGFSASGVGRGRSRGRAAGRAQDSATPQSQQLSRSPGAVRSLKKPPHFADEVTGTDKRGNVIVKAHLASLASEVDIDDLKAHFSNMCRYGCDEEVELSNAVILGGGKAEIVLKGLSDSGLEMLKSRAHKIKSTPVEVDFEQILAGDEGPPPLEGDSDGDEEEKATAIIEVGNVPKTVSIGALKTYFETARSGSCADAVADITNIKPGMFHVTFHDHKVAAQVTSEPRKFKKEVLEIRLLEHKDEADSEATSNEIEVHNVPESVTKKVLKTYFEMGKSGGCPGAVADCRKINEGTFIVTFHDPLVAAQVMSITSHVFKKASLSLRRVKQKGDYRMDQLAICGLPDDVEKEIYELIIADCLNMEEDDDFELVICADSSAVITFAKCYPAEELQAMVSAIASTKVEDTTVTVEMVKVAKPSIHISNITTLCTKKFMEMYFSDEKESGGGEIDSVTICSSSEAIVTFTDPAVNQSVLKRSHPALGPEAVLVEYSGESTEVPESAEPLEIALDPLIAQSIKQCPNSLEQSIHASHVMISTDEEKGLLVLSPSGKSKPNWRQECEELVPQYIAEVMKKEKVKLQKEVAEQAKASVMGLQKENPSLSIAFNNDGTEITIAGESSCVLKAKETINSVCLELVTDTISIPLAPEDYDFLEQVKHYEFPASVECAFDPSNFTVVLKGPAGIVAKLRHTMEEIVGHEDTTVFEDPLLTEFFVTDIGRGKLEKLLQNRQCHTALHFSKFPLSLHFVCDAQEAKTAKAIARQLRMLVTSQTIPIPDTVVSFISDLEEFAQVCQDCEQKHGVLVKHVGHEVSAAGFSADVTCSLAEIKQFLVKMASPLPPLEINVGTLVVRSINRSQQGLQKCLQPFHVSLQCDAARRVLSFSPSHYLKPDWELGCKKSVSEYIQSNIAEQKVVVPKDAYQEIMSVLYSAEQEDGTFVFSYPPNSTALSFAGEPNTVKLTDEKISQICTSHSFVRDKISLKPEVYEYLIQLKIEDLTSKSGVEIEPVPESQALVLSGVSKSVKAVKDNIQTLTAQVLAAPVEVGEAVVQFLASEKGRERLISLLREKRGDKCAILISDSAMKLSILYIPKNKDAAKKASKAIVESTSVLPLNIPDLLLPFLPDMRYEVERLQEEHSAMISVKDREIVVAGFKDGVSQAADAISSFVKAKEAHFRPFSIPIDGMIAECIKDDQEGLQACVSKLCIKCTLKVEKGKSKAKAALCVSPTIATPVNWKENCKPLLTSYIDKEYVQDRIQIFKEAASDVYPILMSTQTNSNFIFTMSEDGAYTIVAGRREVVETFRRKLDDIYNSKQTSIKFELPKRKYDFFTQVIQPTIESGIMIKCSPEKYSVTVCGSIHDVSDVMKSMENVKFSTVPVIVDAVSVKFISTTGRKSLETSIQKAAVKAAIHINTAVHPPTLELLCHHKYVQKIEQLKETFPKQIKMCTVSLPKSVAESAEELHEHCQQLMKKHAILLIPKSDVLQICGFTNIIGEVEKSIEMFIKKKCTVCRSFPIQRGMWRLLGTHMRQRWAKIETLCHDRGVTLQTPSNDKDVIQIDFKGDKVEVQKVTQAMNHLVRSINKSTVPLTRKEIRQYFNEGEDGFCKVPFIERNAKVCIEVCVVGEDMACGIEEDMNTARQTTKHRTIKLSKECTALVVDMKRINLYVGDITEFRADVIVNAANEELKHIGGVADAILKKGGQEIQDVSDRYTRSHGRLRAGDVWLSPTTGRLSCLALIHAVGPRWHGNPSGIQQLKKVCNNCLVTAREYSSIALPAISSGVFGCPIDQCAEVMISTIVAFCNTQRSTALDDINIVVFKPSDAEHFVQALYKQLPRENVRKRSESSTKPSNDSASYLPPSVTVYDSESDYLITSEMYEEPSMPSDDDELPEPVSVGSTSSLSRVLVQQGSILDVEAEIYVNSTNGNMDLSGGAVAQALAKAAGPSLQAECTKKAPIAAGEIAVTGPGNIRRCKCIIHINCPGHDKTGKAEEMLKTIMNRCMRECDRQGASTIVFPAIGTGNLGFPVEIAAHIMVDEVCNYLQKNKCKSLSMVYFIIFMKNMYQTFCDELEKRKKVTVTVPLTNVSSSKDKEKRSKKKTKKSGQRRGRRLEESLNISPHNRYRGQQSIETITSKAGNQPLDLRNGITVEILKGDITAEKTDVIVNSTDKQMRLMGGGVSAALAKKAGAELQRACDEIKPKKKQCLEQGKVLDTRSGNLQCKRVFHIVYHSNFVTIIRSCIERAVELKYTSIAFPGIGTGAEGCPADTAAKEMIKGLQQCTTTYSMHVRIVLFQDEVYKAFRAVIDSDDLQLTWYQRAGRAVRSLIPWSPAYEEGEEAMDINTPENENEEDTELRIFGETEEQVLSAENSLNTLIKKQFTTVEIEDDRICLLHEIQETDLELKARRMQIVFHIDRNLSSIELKGSKESIAEMKLKILDALNKAEKEASRKTQAETMMQTVKWVRQDSSETQYDPVTNLEIEAASRSGNSTYKFTDAVSGENFTINFKEMVEIDHTMGDKKFYIQRVVEGAEGGLPDDWEPMVDPTSKKEVPLRVVDLTVASRGYKFALAEFHKTMTQGTNYKAIVKIERIQNPALYRQYAAKKAQLDAHNPEGVQNELWLFHGTKESSVAKINKTNFNRSFRGQNGTAYGQGTYFARDASFSNGYASPDSQGQKRMYLVRVLAGEYTQGANSMIVAPPKDPNDETVLYDSVVDNISNPSIFVVFYDGDAYPEYLITYT